MPEVLGLDNLDWLTLIRSSYKGLNLNSINPKVLGLNDLNGLTSQCHAYRYLNNFYVMLRYFRPLIRFEITCTITLDKIEVKCLMTCLDCNIYQYSIKVACLFIGCGSSLCSN